MKRIIFFLLLLPIFAAGQNRLSLSPVKKEVALYDYIEFTLQAKQAATFNPFTEADIKGTFTHPTGEVSIAEGFCDAQNGTIYKVRFMPSVPGKYKYNIEYNQQGKAQKFSGSFTATKAAFSGPLRVDPDYPWHFIREGTGEHFFWNSTTTYWLMGWKDEQIIAASIDRLASLGINRIRVAINARQDDGQRWSEPLVKESEKFTFKLTPWVAQRPDDLDDPGFDVTRFNVSHWQKLDRLVAHAREKNVIVSLIFYVDGLDHGCDPFKKANMGNEDEQRYYRYAAARYSAFSNIMWDVTNEYHLFRNEAWVDKMGTLLKQVDPVKHLISVHGNADFPFRKSPWVDVVLYQSWDECGGYTFIRSCRDKQEAAGRILPQVNEEYGYEDHYPIWGCGEGGTKLPPDGRSAENRNKLAWEIYMAGGYQTTGERATDGTGAGNDTGGGWINGRGNPTMTMLASYSIIRNIFEQTEYWKMNPRNELVNYGNLCLAEEGKQYLIYSRLPYCRVALPKGNVFTVTMCNPRTGENKELPDTKETAEAWQYPYDLSDDWVFILRKKL